MLIMLQVMISYMYKCAKLKYEISEDCHEKIENKKREGKQGISKLLEKISEFKRNYHEE